MIKILLLDCDESLAKKLTNKGFKVSTGTMGFSDGKRNIPVALYEQNIIFYNPTNIEFALKAEKAKSEKDQGRLHIKGIINETSEVIVGEDITDFLKRSGVIVTFFNALSKDDIKTEYAVQSWIPNVPFSFPTKDRDLINTVNSDDEQEKAFYYLFKDFSPKLPTKRKSIYHSDYIYPDYFLENQRRDIIASSYKTDDGLVVVLPEFEDNNKVMLHFMDYVYLALYEIKPNLPDFLELQKTSKIKTLTDKRLVKQKLLEETKKEIININTQITEEYNRVENIVKKDPLAASLLGYLEDILDNKLNSWFSAYKITEKVFDYFGNEAEAKKALGLSKEINFIRRIANETHRDTRHAPKPGEVINPPKKEDVDKIVVFSRNIVKASIDKLTNSLVPIRG